MSRTSTIAQGSTLALVVIVAFAGVSGCSHQAVIPEARNVKVARENPSGTCTEVGRVLGLVKSTTGTVEQAIEDMKLDAARKGANAVRIESTGAMGTSVSGVAYQCH